MQQVIKNANILTPQGMQDGLSLLIDNDQIKSLSRSNLATDALTFDVEGDMIIPGFIDTQVNGGGGVLFNDDPSVEGITQIIKAHRRFGTTTVLPTLISDDLEKIALAIDAVDTAIQAGLAGVVGIHLEGPFLNPLKKGIHNQNKFQRLDDAAITLLSSLNHGVTYVTLAPEQTTPDIIRKLTQNGVIVAAGHTNATFDETNAALDAGLSGFTHLYNAMSGLTSREPGVVGAALNHSGSYAGIIVDGFHVHPASIDIAIKAKGLDHIMLVTDAMPCVGADNKTFSLEGLEITVHDGKCTGPDGTLAGSDLDMISAVRNATNWLNINFIDAVQMASLNPANFLGLGQTYGSIEVGKRVDLVRLNASHDVVGTWVNGQYYPV